MIKKNVYIVLVKNNIFSKFTSSISVDLLNIIRKDNANLIINYSNLNKILDSTEDQFLSIRRKGSEYVSLYHQFDLIERYLSDYDYIKFIEI